MRYLLPLTLAVCLPMFASGDDVNDTAGYGSPDGKSAMAKFGGYMADVLPLVQAEMSRAAAASQAEQSAQPKPSGT